MPIRFRCVHCGQLLGIAGRKAGTVVRCPTCQKEVLVPVAGESDSSDPSPPPPFAPPPPPALFERDDFDALLRGSMVSEPNRPGNTAPGAAPGPWTVPAPPAEMSLSGSANPVGTEAPPVLVLSPGRATVLTVVVILLLALAFAAGLLVGRYALGHP